MPKFFVETFENKLTGENADHAVKSLRVRKNEKITVGDSNLTDYYCTVTDIVGGEVLLEVLEKAPNKTEPNVNVTLYQCLLKGDKMSEVIKHSVELGVKKIVPVYSKYCVKNPKDDKKLIERFNKIARSAAMQSYRGIIPEVSMPVSIEKVPKDAILLYEKNGKPLKNVVNTLLSKNKEISVLIGSEGGIAPNEAELFNNRVNLGPRILRGETAPVAVLSCIMLISGNLEDTENETY